MLQWSDLEEYPKRNQGHLLALSINRRLLPTAVWGTELESQCCSPPGLGTPIHCNALSATFIWKLEIRVWPAAHCGICFRSTLEASWSLFPAGEMRKFVSQVSSGIQPTSPGRPVASAFGVFPDRHSLLWDASVWLHLVSAFKTLTGKCTPKIYLGQDFPFTPKRVLENCKFEALFRSHICGLDIFTIKRKENLVLPRPQPKVVNQNIAENKKRIHAGTLNLKFFKLKSWVKMHMHTQSINSILSNQFVHVKEGEEPRSAIWCFLLCYFSLEYVHLYLTVI